MILHDPRVGKTPLAFRAAELRLNGVGRIAFITKAIAREQMRTEAARWAPGLECVVESYDRLAVNEKARFDFRAFQPKIVILDEAQRIKSPGAKRTMVLYGKECHNTGLLHSVPATWILSGTLAPNHIGETWTHLRAFGRTMLSYDAFLSRYCIVVVTKYGPMVVGIREERVEEFKDLIRPISRRRRFRDVYPHLPRAAWNTIQLPVTPKLLREIAKADENLSVASVQHLLRRARTIEEKEAILADAKPHMAALRRVISQIKAPLVVEQAQALLDEGVQKLVIFAWHKDTLDLLAQGLREYGVVQVDGRTSEKRRNAAMNAFQTDPIVRVFVGQIQTAGEAIALHAARHVLFAEYSWTLGDVLQAAKRIVTPDREDRPEIMVAALAGTIDDDIALALQQKAEHADVFNHLEVAA